MWWSLFALSGAYPWTTWPILAGAAGLAIMVRPSILAGPTRVLDACLIAISIAIALQVLPLPLSLRGWISPHEADVRSVLRVGAAPSRWGPLSLSPWSTIQAGLLWIALVVIFWSARALLSRGGVRRLVRSTAHAGLLVSLVAIVQRLVSPLRIYGFWVPFDRGAQPFGPFVNRNHLVAWMLMAVPLVAGYAIVRTDGGSQRGDRADSAATVWLGAAAIVMTAMIFISLSRSGIVSLIVVAAGGALAVRQGRRRIGALPMIVALAAAIAAIAAYVNMPALLARFDTTLDIIHAGVDRRMIWRDTLAMIGDFPLTGVGAGAYQVGMLVYQSTIRSEVFFNHAHNHYLQIAAEGGLLVVVPAVIGASSFVAMARRRMDELSGLSFLRGAALLGLSGVAVQSIWDIGLTVAANGVLFSVLAAIVVHERVAHAQTDMERDREWKVVGSSRGYVDIPA
jgi:O-antigen ligase